MDDRMRCVVVFGTCLVLALGQPAFAQPEQPLTGVIVCEVEIPARKTTCEPIRDSHPLAGTAAVLSIRGSSLWSVEARGDVYSRQDSTYRLLMRLLPLRATASAQPAESTVPIEVFLAVLPIEGRTRSTGADSVSGATIHLRNSDGCRSYTERAQPYRVHLPGSQEGVGPSSEWVFQVPPGVDSFEFLIGFYSPIPASSPAPMRSPDDLPGWFSDPRTSIECTGVSFGTCPPNVIKVMFEPGLSGRARREAISAINGWVVGGDSYVNEYYVQFLSDRSPQRLREALERIRAFPGVTRASPISLIAPAPGGMR